MQRLRLPGYSNRSASEPTLVYVYLGHPIPRYAQHSLAMNSSRSGADQLLISNVEQPHLKSNINLIRAEEFYDPARFLEFRNKARVDRLFRGGFWLHAIERLFVLEQFAHTVQESPFFHAELDVLIFGLEGLAQELDSQARGVFAPPEYSDRALASLIYVNDKRGLAKLIRYVEANAHLGNEMTILGSFLRDEPKWGHALPSDRSFDGRWPFGLLSVPRMSGIVDTSGFGNWILGQDPRNEKFSSWNHTKGALDYPIESIRFRSDWFGRRLTARLLEGETQKIRALHVHSKVFGRLRIPGVLKAYSFAAGFKRRVLIVPSIRGPKNLLLETVINRTNPAPIGAFGLSAMFLETLLRWLSRGRRYPLSNRQLRLVARILPPLTPSVRDAHPISLFLKRQRIPVAVGTVKDYRINRLVVAMWPETSAVASWSFGELQPGFNEDWLKEMFPSGQTDLTRLRALARDAGIAELPLEQCWAFWSLTFKPDMVRLVGFSSSD